MPKLPAPWKYTLMRTGLQFERKKDKPKVWQVVYGDAVQEWQAGFKYDILLGWQVHTDWSPWFTLGQVELCHLFSGNKFLRDLKSSTALHSLTARLSRAEKVNENSSLQMTPSWCLLRLHHPAERLEASFSKSNVLWRSKSREGNSFSQGIAMAVSIFCLY